MRTIAHTPAGRECGFDSLGCGHIAYIRTLSTKEARALYPDAGKLRGTGYWFSLHAADGAPLALAETWADAFMCGTEEGLVIQRLH